MTYYIISKEIFQNLSREQLKNDVILPIMQRKINDELTVYDYRDIEIYGSFRSYENVHGDFTVYHPWNADKNNETRGSIHILPSNKFIIKLRKNGTSGFLAHNFDESYALIINDGRFTDLCNLFGIMHTFDNIDGKLDITFDSAKIYKLNRQFSSTFGIYKPKYISYYYRVSNNMIKINQEYIISHPLDGEKCGGCNCELEIFEYVYFPEPNFYCPCCADFVYEIFLVHNSSFDSAATSRKLIPINDDLLKYKVIQTANGFFSMGSVLFVSIANFNEFDYIRKKKYTSIVLY
jgi:hypothetical protein